MVCHVVSGFLQFFMLSTFVWMGVYAVSLYRAIVLVFKGRSDEKFFIAANIVAWGECWLSLTFYGDFVYH